MRRPFTFDLLTWGHPFIGMMTSEDSMGAWQGVTMDSLKFHPGPTCLTLLRPAGEPPLKRPYRCFRGGLPTKRKACGRLLPPWTTHAVRLWCSGSRCVGSSLLPPMGGPLEIIADFGSRPHWFTTKGQKRSGVTVTQNVSKMGWILDSLS
jgi:hypothetical protein